MAGQSLFGSKLAILYLIIRSDLLQLHSWAKERSKMTTCSAQAKANNKSAPSTLPGRTGRGKYQPRPDFHLISRTLPQVRVYDRARRRSRDGGRRDDQLG